MTMEEGTTLRVAVLTSGDYAPGMNGAMRVVARVRDLRRAGARSQEAIGGQGGRAGGHWREREPDRRAMTGGAVH